MRPTAHAPASDTFLSPAGTLYVFFSGRALSGIEFDRPDKALQSKQANYKKMPVSFKKQLEAYFSGRLKAFNQELIFLCGSAFEQGVWLSLKDIPYGETRPYKWLAAKAGSPGAARAVGQALSRNPLPLILPCHRVISSDGSIGGFSPRLEIKEWLLRHEAQNRD